MSAVVATAFAVAACSGQTTPEAAQPAAGTALDRAAATITASDMYARIAFLADDALRGRDTPSPGLEVAAAYLASEFRRIGLEPAGDDGSYLQRYPFVIRSLDVAGVSLVLQTPDGALPLGYASDFYVAAGEPQAVEAGVTYAGSVIAPEANLRDQVAVISTAGPINRDFRINLNRARAAASNAGARALLVILDAALGADAVRAQAAASVRSTSVQPQIPVAFLRRDHALAMFRSADLELDRLERRSSAQPVALPGVTLALAAPFSDVDHQPANVVAVLPGSDSTLRNTYVVFSAHYDHVGVRAHASGDSIYNGADDDASGTAAIVDIAEAFASLPQPPARSLIFLAVSGEEKGLLGSRYYSDHPTVPIGDIVANVNIDMIGRNAPDSIVAIGQDFSSLGPLLQRVSAERAALGLTVAQDIWPEQNFFFRSDHFNFARREIPAIFFFAGVHEDYHQPSDEVDKLDTDKIARVARLVFWLGHAIASDPAAPQWSPEGLARVRELTR
jgi:hypothetical protein